MRTIALEEHFTTAECLAARAFLDAIPVAPADREKVAHTNADRLLRLSA
jgi:predicted TIM-barrel fold metal-dependent hydrolase